MKYGSICAATRRDGAAAVRVVLTGPSQCSLLSRLDRHAGFRRKEDADGTAFWPQRPRCHSKTSKDERGEDVKGVSAVATDRCAGCGRACQVEEYAGIRPFLEPWKARHEYGNGSKRLPKSQDGKEVHWVAKDGHDAMGVAEILCDLRDPAASVKKIYKNGRYPKGKVYYFLVHSHPHTPSSTPPTNFFHPSLSPRTV